MGPTRTKGWCSRLNGLAAPAPWPNRPSPSWTRTWPHPIRKGESKSHRDSAWLRGQATLGRPALGLDPLAATYKRMGGAAQGDQALAAPALAAPLHHHLLAAPPLALGAAAPPPPPLPLARLGEALSVGDLRHQPHHNHRGAEIYLTTPSLLAGSRRRSLHRAVRVDTAEALLLRRFIGLDRMDNTSPRD